MMLSTIPSSEPSSGESPSAETSSSEKKLSKLLKYIKNKSEELIIGSVFVFIILIALYLYLVIYDFNIYYKGQISEVKLTQATVLGSEEVPYQMKAFETVTFANEKGESVLNIVDFINNTNVVASDELPIGENSTFKIPTDSQFIIQLSNDTPEKAAVCDIEIKFYPNKAEVIFSNLDGYVIELISKGDFYLSKRANDIVSSGKYYVTGVDYVKFYIDLKDLEHSFFSLPFMLQTVEDVSFRSADEVNKINYLDRYEHEIYLGDDVKISPKKNTGIIISVAFNENEEQFLQLDKSQVIKGCYVNNKTIFGFPEILFYKLLGKIGS